MIIQASMRTDIAAFYAEWFSRRLKAGEVYVRNPYNRSAVTRYRLSPQLVDVIAICTKNPAPLFSYTDLLAPYGQYWFVTITPYDADFEPNVPPKEKIIAAFCELSHRIGKEAVGWRYDPIIISEKYSVEYHLTAFKKMAAALSDHTQVCVISFIDIYQKVARNFPVARPVRKNDRQRLGREFSRIGAEYGITLKACAEGDELSEYGIDCSGCLTRQTYEAAIGQSLKMPKKKSARPECACELGSDIGAYDACGHLCRYCYANANPAAVKRNLPRHDVASPFLIGRQEIGDIIREAKQESWRSKEIKLF